MSTVLLTTVAEYPQTSLITCSRETTAPLARGSASSKANFFGANSTVCDARRAVREAGSTFDEAETMHLPHISGARASPVSAAKQGLDPCQQLQEPERLCHVIVRPIRSPRPCRPLLPSLSVGGPGLPVHLGAMIAIHGTRPIPAASGRESRGQDSPSRMPSGQPFHPPQPSRLRSLRSPSCFADRMPIAIVLNQQDSVQDDSSSCSLRAPSSPLERGSSTTKFAPPRSPVVTEHWPP